MRGSSQFHARRQRFLEEGTPFLQALTKVGHPKIIYHLIEAVAGLEQYDPITAICLIGAYLREGERWGIGRERLALDEVLALIERYLSTYRELVRENEAVRSALLDSLGVFIRTGWTDAVRLALALDQIYE